HETNQPTCVHKSRAPVIRANPKLPPVGICVFPSDGSPPTSPATENQPKRAPRSSVNPNDPRTVEIMSAHNPPPTRNAYAARSGGFGGSGSGGRTGGMGHSRGHKSERDGGAGREHAGHGEGRAGGLRAYLFPRLSSVSKKSPESMDARSTRTS